MRNWGLLVASLNGEAFNEQKPTQRCALTLFSMASVYHIYLVIISIIANALLATLNLGKELERKARNWLPEAHAERRPKVLARAAGT